MGGENGTGKPSQPDGAKMGQANLRNQMSVELPAIVLVIIHVFPVLCVLPFNSFLCHDTALFSISSLSAAACRHSGPGEIAPQQTILEISSKTERNRVSERGFWLLLSSDKRDVAALVVG